MSNGYHTQNLKKNIEKWGTFHAILVLASRASGRHLDNQTLKNHLEGHPRFFVISQNVNFKGNDKYFHLNIIPISGHYII